MIVGHFHQDNLHGSSPDSQHPPASGQQQAVVAAAVEPDSHLLADLDVHQERLLVAAAGDIQPAVGARSQLAVVKGSLRHRVVAEGSHRLMDSRRRQIQTEVIVVGQAAVNKVAAGAVPVVQCCRRGQGTVAAPR